MHTHRSGTVLVFALALVALVAVAVAHSHSGRKGSDPSHSHSHSHSGSHSHSHEQPRARPRGHSHEHGHGGHGGGHDHSHSGGKADKKARAEKPPMSSEASKRPDLEAYLKPVKERYAEETRKAVAAFIKDGGEMGGPKGAGGAGTVTFDAGSATLSWWETVGYTLGGSLVTSIAPALLLVLVPRRLGKKSLNVLLAFAAGGLLGDVFLHMLPHVLDSHDHHDHDHGGSDAHKHLDILGELKLDGKHEEHGGHASIPAQTAMLLVLAGIGAFFLLEGILFGGSSSHHHHHGHSHGHGEGEKKEKKKVAKEKLSDDDDNDADQPSPKTNPLQSKKFAAPKTASSTSEAAAKDECDGESTAATAEQQQRKRAWLNLLADSTHNFTDGMAIGASFLASQSIGMRTVLVVLIHEVPHELGDFAVLRDCGWSMTAIIGAQLFTAIGNLAGAVAVLAATATVHELQPYIMPFVAGTFIYVAAVSILSDLSGVTSRYQRALQTFAFVAGVACLRYVTVLEERLGVHQH